jgi:hypothetical protein
MKTKFGYFDKDFNVIETIEVDIHSIKSDDPIAFAYGVSRGMQCQSKSKYDRWDSKSIHGSLHSELAPEYLRGFLLGFKGYLVPEGTKLRKGDELSFRHTDKRIDPKTLQK